MKSKLALAVAIVAIVSAAGIVVATNSGGIPAQKIAFSFSDLKDTYNANTTAISLGSGILKVPNDEEAIITFDADVGLDTNTTIKGNGQTATSDTNYASVQAYAMVTPMAFDNSGNLVPTGPSYMAQPGVITLADRLQTLSGLLSAGTILPNGTVTNATPEWISFMLNTTNAEGWHFVTNLSCSPCSSNSGIYKIEVFGQVTLSASGQTAQMPVAIIGPRTLIVEEVRQIKDNSGNLFFS